AAAALGDRRGPHPLDRRRPRWSRRNRRPHHRPRGWPRSNRSPPAAHPGAVGLHPPWPGRRRGPLVRAEPRAATSLRTQKGVIPMSKPVVDRLFIAAIVAVIAGWVVAIVAIIAALAGGAVTIGGPNVVTVNGESFASAL